MITKRNVNPEYVDWPVNTLESVDTWHVGESVSIMGLLWLKWTLDMGALQATSVVTFT